ncbi:MAG: NAD-dependent epimerase/dehydratase family protein [Solirubrobacterales bacterium]|nr:NAD-dependent epimerase/dehydratase family protein [Solirubrobacterales bacterium]
MSQHVVVTGSEGFLGRHVVRTLAAAGDRVTAIDHRPPSRDLPPGVHAVQGDCADPGHGRLLERADVVVHLAAETGVRGSWSSDFAAYARENLAALHAVALGVADGRGRLVLASSSTVYGNCDGPVTEDRAPAPRSPYAVTKLAGETLAHAHCEERGLRVTTLRLFTTYGPGQRADMLVSRLLAAAYAGRQVDVAGDPDMARDLTYVGDVVRAIHAACRIDPGPEPVNIGTGRAVPLRDVVAAVQQAAGAELTVRWIPRPPGDAVQTWADPSRARRVLGWRPSTSLEDGIRAQAAEQLQRSAA